MQRGLTKARLTVAIENNGAGVHILRRSISHGRPTQTSVVQQQQKRRKCQGGPKDFARVPWVHGSWRRRMTGAIAKGYCALQWDFTVEAAATPRRSRSSLIPCGQKFDSERWRLLTGFRPAGCAVSTANGRGFRSAPGWYRPSEEGFPRRDRVRAGPRFGLLRFPF